MQQSGQQFLKTEVKGYKTPDDVMEEPGAPSSGLDTTPSTRLADFKPNIRSLSIIKALEHYGQAHNPEDYIVDFSEHLPEKIQLQIREKLNQIQQAFSLGLPFDL